MRLPLSLRNFLSTVALVSFLVAQYWAWTSFRHLSPQGQDRFWLVLFSFSSANNFTEQGQKYMVRARWAIFLTFACIIAAGVIRFSK
ncbi:MAG TPA: hypothetical protein VFV05_13870 [Methylomirabilota bacterium]|nr:hypothetical protein [Methylomirabilota bacterium]